MSGVTNTSALLSWSPPDNDGGRPGVFYTVHTYFSMSFLFPIITVTNSIELESHYKVQFSLATLTPSKTIISYPYSYILLLTRMKQLPSLNRLSFLHVENVTRVPKFFFVNYRTCTLVPLYIDGSLAKREFVMNKTAHTATGLTPGVLYTFSVSSENAVSSEDSNVNDRSINITATTLQGGKITGKQWNLRTTGATSFFSFVKRLSLSRYNLKY